jgi:hypothetical protein
MKADTNFDTQTSSPSLQNCKDIVWYETDIA